MTTSGLPATGKRPSNGISKLVDRAYRRHVHFRAEYVELIDRVHHHMNPRTYAEIGVASGRTLALALPGTVAVGIDPDPRIKFPLRRNARVFKATSDDFFEQENVIAIFGGNPIELAFIDGMHRFEFALRDFMNVERYASRQSVVLLHDCLPPDEISQRRERESKVWTGDVWKLIVCLKEQRPDLTVRVVDVPPAGLGIITGLDPTSRLLEERYDRILDRYLPLPFEFVTGNGEAQVLSLMPNDWAMVEAMLPCERRANFITTAVKSWIVVREASRSKVASLKHAAGRLDGLVRNHEH
jgi:Methyltransferase domain